MSNTVEDSMSLSVIYDSSVIESDWVYKLSSDVIESKDD